MGDTTWMQDCVREFHLATDNPAPNNPAVAQVRTRLRAKLIMEEAIETVEAMGFNVYAVSRRPDPAETHYGPPPSAEELAEREKAKPRVNLTRARDPDWVETVDGLCDNIYVCLGTAVEMGLNLNPFFREVHRSNMLKVGGPVRADGKSLKPPGWEPPRIKYLLDRALARGLAAAKSSELGRGEDPLCYCDEASVDPNRAFCPVHK